MIKIEHDYHVVELYHIPWEVIEWCQERFGAGDGSRWMIKNNKIYFANKLDHMMFLVRWS